MQVFSKSRLSIPGFADHYHILRKLRVGTKLDLVKILSLTSLTVFFEAWGIAMVLPIIGFLRHDSDPAVFAESSKIGKYVVEAFYYVGLPVNLLSLCSVAIVMISMRQVLNYFHTIHIDRIKLQVGRDLCIRCFEGILGSNAETIGQYRAGQFAALVQHECQAAASVIRNYARIWSQLLTLGIYMVIMLAMAPLASLGAMTLIGGMMISMGVLIKVTRRLAARRIEVRADFISFLNERFRTWRLIKTGNTLAYEGGKTREFAQLDLNTEYAVTRIGGLLQLILTPVVMFVALFALYFAIEHLQVEVDKVAMFMVILLRLVPTGQNLNGQRNQLASYEPSLRLVKRTLDQAQAQKENMTVGKDLPELDKEILFQDVSFTYQGQDDRVLENVNCVIPAGKMTAIIGHSGAGKSTLIDLILRLYAPDHGRILYDGVPLDEFNLASFRHGIACVTQESLIFDDSVLENVRYLKRDASMEEVEEAIRCAHAHEFIESLPEKYETRLGENGARLSGGEKQRIALARTFLSGAKIIILDEPTSALDYDSESKIQEAIERFVKEMGLTVIVIAHRLSTIKNADLVLQFSKGKLVRQGSPKDLLTDVTAIAEEAALY